MTGELPFRGSIEGGYVGMARFIAQHPSVGLESAAVLRTAHAVHVRARTAVPTALWHASAARDRSGLWCIARSTALATCLGPVTLFLFALHFTRSRKWASVAAVAYSLLSPSYGLFPAVEKDRGIVQLPWRMQVLAKYGEGPHNTGLTLLPLALLAVWLAASEAQFRDASSRPRSCWPRFRSPTGVAAFALAISCLLLLLAAWGEPDFRGVARAGRCGARLPAGVLLADAQLHRHRRLQLAGRFLRLQGRAISRNWRWRGWCRRARDPRGLPLAPRLVLFLPGHAGGVRLRLDRYRFYYVSGVDMIPESRRYAIEFELFLVLALVEGLRLAFASPTPPYSSARRAPSA